MAEFTLDMATLLESWGWQFSGDDIITGTHWAKYDGAEAVATFEDAEWKRDFLAARAVITNEVLHDGIPTGNLSEAVAHAMRARRWRWALTSDVTGEWFKFKANGMCEARQGDWIWSQDLCEAKRTARGCPDAESWEVMPEVRWRIDSVGGCYLQQQWRLPASGHVEWRDVKAVDKHGDPVV